MTKEFGKYMYLSLYMMVQYDMLLTHTLVLTLVRQAVHRPPTHAQMSKTLRGHFFTVTPA